MKIDGTKMITLIFCVLGETAGVIRVDKEWLSYPTDASVKGGIHRIFNAEKDLEKLFGDESSGWKLRASRGDQPGTILITCNSPNPQVYIAKVCDEPRWLHMKIQGPEMHLINASKLSIWYMGDEVKNEKIYPLKQ